MEFKVKIIYEFEVSKKVLSAIDNVFENFSTFCDFHKVNIPAGEIHVSNNPNSDCLFLSKKFIQLIESNELRHSAWFHDKPVLVDDGRNDYIGTCFYMINCLQEWGEPNTDSMGRFQFRDSYQSKFECVEENLVGSYFKIIANDLGIASTFDSPSKYFLTHDIDLLYEGWKQNVKHELLRGKWISAIRILWEFYSGKNDWKNIETILELESNHNLESTFFWLVNDGKTAYPNVKNADYFLDDPYVKSMMEKIELSAHAKNGLHKSISNDSFMEELNKFPLAAKPKINRYHYLNYHPKKEFKKLSDSAITYDCSMGFSERIGFRNSYGLPFKPYDLEHDCSFNFTEIPLLVMDATLYHHLNYNGEKAEYTINQFMEKNKTGCILSFLFHNNFYTGPKYAGYRKTIETILPKLTKSYTLI